MGKKKRPGPDGDKVFRVGVVFTLLGVFNNPETF